MNDRYLFKAKRKNWKELPKEEWWVAGSHVYTFTPGKKCAVVGLMEENHLIVEENGHICIIDQSTLCQCTGLKDKEKNLIWENDVVRCIDRNSGAEFIAVVEFGNPNGFYSWGYQLKHIKGDEPNLDILLWVEMEETGATIEVIGSIFDNPELLEVE